MISTTLSPMKRSSHTRSLVLLVLLSVGAANAAAGEIFPDFLLEDVNTTSATYGQDVSPRDYWTQVSGWYFGHAP